MSFFNKRSSTISFVKSLVEAITGFPLLLVIFFTLLMTFSSSESEVSLSLVFDTDPSSIPYNYLSECLSGTSPTLSFNKWSYPLQKIVPISLEQCSRYNYSRHSYDIGKSPHNILTLASSLIKQKIFLQI